MQAQGSRCTSVISSLQRFNVTSASRWRSSSTVVPFATWKELKPSAVGHAPCGGLSPRFQRVGLCEGSPVESLEATATPGMSAVRGGSGLLGPLWASDGLLDGCRMWLASLWSSSGSGGLGPNRVILAMTSSARSCPLAWLSSTALQPRVVASPLLRGLGERLATCFGQSVDSPFRCWASSSSTCSCKVQGFSNLSPCTPAVLELRLLLLHALCCRLAGCCCPQWSWSEFLHPAHVILQL